ncbi:MAG: GtrA family protein [Bacteroidetes bacterium]|nr:GtrA family protein [Bacteroidota bacterium]
MTELLSKAFLLKFVKFCLVGFSGVFVDFGITYLCKEIFKIHKYISNVIGFSIAATTNYILNRIWTFESHNPRIAVEFSRFFVISLIGLGINSLILYILVSRFKMNFYLSKLFATIVVTVWNFLINAYYTFV